MLYLRIAGIAVAIDNRYPLVEQRCAGYAVPAMPEPDIALAPGPDGVARMRQAFQEKWGLSLTDEEAEERCVYFGVYQRLPRFGAFWVHAALVGMDGEGYAFSAPSGTGKTTHARQWLKAFGPRARIVNGDLPVIRREGGTYWAYGTPFCGKEGYNENGRVALRGLAFLERGGGDSVRPADAAFAFGRLVFDHSTWIGPRNQGSYLDLLQGFVEDVPMWRLVCRPDEEAARVAYEAMSRGR